MTIKENPTNLFNLEQIINQSVELLKRQIEEEKKQKLVEVKELEELRETIIKKHKDNKLYSLVENGLKIEKEEFSILINFFLFYIEGMDKSNSNITKLIDFTNRMIEKYSLKN